MLPADLPAWIPATPKRHTTGREHLSFPGLNKWNLGLFPLIICKQYKKLCIFFGWGKDVCWIMVLPGFYTIWDSISIFLNQRALTSTLAAIETATYKPSIGMRVFRTPSAQAAHGVIWSFSKGWIMSNLSTLRQSNMAIDNPLKVQVFTDVRSVVEHLSIPFEDLKVELIVPYCSICFMA